MKKLLLISVILIFSIKSSSLSLFKEPEQTDYQSYEGLIEAADKNDLKALNMLKESWSNEASQFSFISNFLKQHGNNNNGYGLKQVEDKIKQIKTKNENDGIPPAPPLEPSDKKHKKDKEAPIKQRDKSKKPGASELIEQMKKLKRRKRLTPYEDKLLRLISISDPNKGDKNERLKKEKYKNDFKDFRNFLIAIENRVDNKQLNQNKAIDELNALEAGINFLLYATSENIRIRNLAKHHKKYKTFFFEYEDLINPKKHKELPENNEDWETD